MSLITLGHSQDKKAVKLSLPILLRTHLQIQGASGSGKSWLVRLLAEQLFGKVPVIIIDQEGEYATLREKFDYILVGKGGEAAIFNYLHDLHPLSAPRDVVAENSGASVLSSAYANNVSALKSAGMIEYLANRELKASDWLFID